MRLREWGVYAAQLHTLEQPQGHNKDNPRSKQVEPLAKSRLCTFYASPVRHAALLRLPGLSFRKVDRFHILSNTIFKFLLKQHKKCTITLNLPLNHQSSLAVTSVDSKPH